MKADISSFVIYSHSDYVNRQSFLNELTGDGLCIEEELTLDTSLIEFLDKLKTIVENTDPGSDVFFRGNHHTEYDIVAQTGSALHLLVQVRWHSDGDINISEKSVFGVTITGNPKSVQNILRLLRETFPERLSRVRWWFMSGQDLTYHDVVLQKPSSVKPEYYPFMGEDPMKYMNRYLKHRASLLFLSGLSGTGKTTLLRNFLYENQLRAVVTYEDVLFDSDRMFVDFVTSNKHDVMIIEDADIMIGSREHSGNKMIARFLNASNGIIQLQNKKIIFTTNLNNFNDVDEALIRPGRSYGSVMFRALSPREANAAAFEAGIQNWTTPDHDVTLAEIFNPPNASSFGKRTLGFTS